MGKHHTGHCDIMLVCEVLMFPFPFLDRDCRHPSPSRAMVPECHTAVKIICNLRIVITSCFEQLCIDITNSRLMSIPQLCHSLYDLVQPSTYMRLDIVIKTLDEWSKPKRFMDAHLSENIGKLTDKVVLGLCELPCAGCVSVVYL